MRPIRVVGGRVSQLVGLAVLLIVPGVPLSRAANLGSLAETGGHGEADAAAWHAAMGIPKADDALTFELAYVADVFVNARGGANTADAVQYRGLVDVAFTLDTEQAGLWPGGTFFANFIDNHGTDITERHVGDLQVINNIDAPNESRAYEFYYTHAWWDGRFRIKVGKMDANNDFAAGLYHDEFIHSSPGFSPTMPLITWPETALGIVLYLEPFDDCYATAGIFDAEGTSSRSGFETAFRAPADTFTIFELGWRPTLTLFGQTGLPGQYAVGGFYHSGRWPLIFDDLDGRLSPRFATGNAGLFVTCDQFVYRETATEDAETEQGLGVFLQFGWSPSDRNEISQHYGAGFQYYGLIPTRDRDVFGLGVQHISLSGAVQSLEDRFSETAIELFYKAQISEWLTAKPDLQYVINPGGAGRDALIAGVRWEFSF
jgi:porin